jgi:hypothetical protein
MRYWRRHPISFQQCHQILDLEPASWSFRISTPADRYRVFSARVKSPRTGGIVKYKSENAYVKVGLGVRLRSALDRLEFNKTLAQS